MKVSERFKRLDFYSRWLVFGGCVWVVLFASALGASALGHDLPVWLWGALTLLFVGALVTGTWAMAFGVWRSYLASEASDDEAGRNEHTVATGCASVFALGMTTIGAIFVIVIAKEILRG